MKKIYLFVSAALMTTGLFAQQSAIVEAPVAAKQECQVSAHVNGSKVTSNKSLVDIWTSDFSDPTEWTVGNDGTPSTDWVIGTAPPTGYFSSTYGVITSTSGGNYAMFDSNGLAEDFGVGTQDAWIGTVNPIDLSAYPLVVLSVESYYTAYTTSTATLEVSNDGVGWTSFDLHPGVGSNESSANPEVVSVNISSVAGNQAAVYVRFRYTGVDDYVWTLDDVVISDLPADDLRLNYTVISQTPGEGFEYARIPSSQMGDLAWGGQFFNFGANDQTNSSLAIDFSHSVSGPVFADASAGVVVPSDDTVDVDIIESGIAWEVGTYNASFTLTSDEEMPGATFIDNEEDRLFEVNETRYAIDGLGVYPSPDLTTIGTPSWPEGADNFFVAAEYRVTADLDVEGIEFVVSISSVPGALIEAFLMDTTDWMAGNAENDLFWLAQTGEYELTVADSTAGTVSLLFDNGDYTLTPGSYYAVLKLSSLSNTYPIRILDDETVPQPGSAGMIYVPGFAQANPPSSPGPYGNGNAYAIRLMIDDPLVDALDEVNSVSVIGQNVPNPALDITRIDYELVSSEAVRMVVTDITGKVVIDEAMGTKAPGVYSHNLNVSQLSAGTYHYSIVTESGRATKKMTVVK